jgi:hypothetical protein
MALSIYSGGAGHGDYGFARGFYPLPMLLTQITDDTIAQPSIVLALLQYPVAGFAIGCALRYTKKSGIAMTIVLLVIHASGLVFAFGGWLPHFSG